MTKFRYARTETRPDFPGMADVPASSTIYAVFSFWNDVPMGWVARGAGREWWAWNQHGDFWHSWAPSRETAADDMLRAPSSHFRRRAA